MVARIYKPSKTAMQSGMARTKQWVLEFSPESAKDIDPLMGWTGSGDMRSQVKLYFGTKEEAISYAKRSGIPYHVKEPAKRRAVKKSYADNFKYGRIGIWTH